MMQMNITAGKLADIIQQNDFDSVVFDDGCHVGAVFTHRPHRQLDEQLLNESKDECPQEWAVEVSVFGKRGLEVGYSYSAPEFPRRLVFPAEASDKCLKVKDAKVIGRELRLYPC